MASTIKVQATLDFARIYPSLTAVLGSPVAGYGGNAIPVRLANKVLQDVLQKPFAWKWNRKLPTAFTTNSLQQDYSTSITDLGWLEDCIRTALNTAAIPPMVRGIGSVRELLPCSVQGMPDQICWLPNSEAICGTWTANQKFVDPSTQKSMIPQPLTQIRDSNGNIQVMTTFGTTGGAEPPTWGTVVGGVTADGTAAWTMVDPNGITFRLSPMPYQNGIPWLVQPYYQQKPATITAVTGLWTIPDEYSNVYEQGFLAYAWDAAEDTARFEKEYALFQLLIQKALGAADREDESFGITPSRSLTGRRGTVERGLYPPGLWN